MKITRKGVWILFLVLGNVAGAATITLSLVRTTMPEEQWSQMTTSFQAYESLLKEYAADSEWGYRVTAGGDSIDFTYEFPGGWDYDFYRSWQKDYIDALNAAIRSGGQDPGFKWALRVDGEISLESNPWREVEWLPAVQVVDGEYLNAPSLGWFYAPNWAPEGNFWAYAYNLEEMGWLYVYGHGYYYSINGQGWYWNLPNTAWFYSYGNGTWAMHLHQTDPSIDALDAIIEDERVKQNLPGLAVGVVRNGEIVHLKGYGFSDIENEAPITTRTTFRWASISKTLTAVATLRMAELDDDFALSDRVVDHVDYWTDSTSNDHSKITVEHLLTNRSGIHHYGDGRDEDGDDVPDNTYSWDASVYQSESDGYNAQQAVAVFKDADLDFTPGTKYLYSTFGFNLLGSVLDEASPDGYVQWVQDQIGDPLNMSSLAVSTVSRAGYQRACDGWLNPRTVNSVEWRLPGGGWESNIRDLTRFAEGIVDETLLDDTSLLWSEFMTDPDAYRYGINDFGPLKSHGGAHANLRTLLDVFPADDYAVTIMTWAEYADTRRIASRIHNYYGWNYGVDTSPVDKCGDDMESCDGLFAGVWRKTGDDVIIRRGYSHDAFLSEWRYLRSQGYYCDDFEADVRDGELRWDGVFRMGSGGNGIWRNYLFDDFKTKWEEQSERGYQLVDLETYVINGQRRWAGLFRPGRGTTAMWRGLSTSDFADRREEMDELGLKLIDIEVYVSNGEPRWSGIWVEGEEGLLNRNYTTGEFNALWQARREIGWKLVDIEAYRIDGELLWAGIWEESSLADRLNRNFDYCALMDLHADYSGDGFELIDLEYYR